MSASKWLKLLARTVTCSAPALAGLLPAAQPGRGASQACSHLLTGTYLSRIVNGQGVLLSRSILNFQAGGSLLSIDSNQAGIPTQFNPFTSNTGEWACTGHTTATASAMSFTLPGSESPNPGLARNDFTIRIDPRTGAIDGTIELIYYPLEGDPLNGVGVSAGVFPFTAEPLVLRRQ